VPPALKARIEREAKLGFDLGEQLYLAGRYDEAFRQWQAIAARYPGTQGEAVCHRCMAQYWKNIKRQPALALEEYDRAIHLDPDGQIGRDALFGKAHALYLLGDYKQSFRLLARLQRLRVRGELGVNIHRWYMRAWRQYAQREQWRARGIRVADRPDRDCGPRALSVVCNRLGVRTTREEIRELSRMQPDGATLLDLKRAAQALGLRSTGMVVNVARLRRMRLPVVAHTGEDHFVAVINADRQGVDYIDGDFGRLHLDWDQFALIWKGVILTVDAQKRS